jgi:ubiquinone/menaquinone biosynthesis C-methylase UbiE
MEEWKAMNAHEHIQEALPPFSTVLDIGAGNGLLTNTLHKKGFTTFALDLRHIYRGPEGRFVIANAKAIPFRTGSIDLVTMTMFLQDVESFQPKEQLAEYVPEIIRALQPTGFVYLGGNYATAYRKLFMKECNLLPDSWDHEAFFQKRG